MAVYPETPRLAKAFKGFQALNENALNYTNKDSKRPSLLQKKLCLFHKKMLNPL